VIRSKILAQTQKFLAQADPTPLHLVLPPLQMGPLVILIVNLRMMMRSIFQMKKMIKAIVPQIRDLLCILQLDLKN